MMKNLAVNCFLRLLSGGMILLLQLAYPVCAAPVDNAISWENTLLYPDTRSTVNMSYLNHYDIDKNGIVFIKDAHFWTKRGRVNFFGTNLIYDACYPDKEMAEKLAAQLAGLGINIVRLHHMDNSQIWGKNAAAFTDFDAAKLDKLDYFIFCLKRQGIYIDLNLHVSWQYTNDKTSPLYSLIREQDSFRYGKGLDTFLPELIEKQKGYAKKLLTHYNPYTGLMYKDDPVTAMIEINNENSFYRNMLFQGGIDLLPPIYREVLNTEFRKFLLTKYQSFATLKKAWQIREDGPKAVEMPMQPLAERNNWRVQITDPQKGTISLQDGEAVVHLNYGEKNRFFQFYKTNLTFKAGQDYTLVMDVSGPKDATFAVNAMRQEAPYDNAGLTRTVKLNDGDHSLIAVSFKATKDLDGLGRITLADFTGGNDFVLHSVKLYRGKYVIGPLQGIASMENVNLPALASFSAYPDQYQNDITAFFQQTEFNYWSEMMRYIKKDLGVRAPVTGTQIDYSSPELADIYDYVDIHSYWQHPTFPGKRWDGKNYYVKNVSMVSEPRTNFDKIALFRLKGKPFTISEYNHPYPNLYNAETPLMLSVVSKLQDYDGIFVFNYLNNLNLDLASYFAHYDKFAAKAVYPATALIFRDLAVKALPEEVVWRLGKNDLTDDRKQLKRYINPYVNELDKRPSELFTLYHTKRIALQLSEQGISDPSKMNFTGYGADQHFTWDNTQNNYQHTFFKFDEAKAKVYIGWNTREQYNFDKAALQISGAPGKYFQFTLINQEGNIGEKGHYILTLAGREFYEGVNYFDYDTKTPLNLADENYRSKIMAIPVRKQSTERIETFDAVFRLNLRKPYPFIAVYTINALGEKEKNVPFRVTGDELEFDLKQANDSIVYCLEIVD